jgi:hypothetical protein
MPNDHAPRHRLLLAFSLFLLPPLVGEWLLGNQPITELASLILLAPMYGSGALLVREVARRAGRGWPTMILLAAAYALIEEGPIDQMFWNPHYGGFDMGAAYASTHIPLLDTSIQMLQDVLSMHTIWSICVPIALIETFSRDERTRPWLGNFGLGATGIVFGAGSVFLAYSQVQSEDFMAPPGQFTAMVAAIVALIMVAFMVGRRPSPTLDAAAPNPWVVGAVTFCASSLYWGRDFLPESLSPWVIVGAWFVLVTAAMTLFTRWSRSRGWGAAHRLALAGGALLTYVWVGFEQGQYLDVSRTTSLLGNIVFGAGALILLAAAARTLPRQTPHRRRRERAPLATM